MNFARGYGLRYDRSRGHDGAAAHMNAREQNSTACDPSVIVKHDGQCNPLPMGICHIMRCRQDPNPIINNDIRTYGDWSKQSYLAAT
jgi:hypothetical protein